MDNKVLIKLIVASTGEEIDCFVPINEKIYNLKKVFLKYVFDVTSIEEDILNKYLIVNVRTNKIYNNNERVFNTDIRNGTEIVILQAT